MTNNITKNSKLHRTILTVPRPQKARFQMPRQEKTWRSNRTKTEKISGSCSSDGLCGEPFLSNRHEEEQSQRLSPGTGNIKGSSPGEPSLNQEI